MNLSACELEWIVNNCKLLQDLHRQMDRCQSANALTRDNEAEAMASTTPNLKRLNIGGLSVTTAGVHKILGTCSELDELSL